MSEAEKIRARRIGWGEAYQSDNYGGQWWSHPNGYLVRERFVASIVEDQLKNHIWFDQNNERVE